MRTSILRVMLIGAAIFAVLSLLENIPYLGWFGGLVSLGLWVYLASQLVQADRPHLSQQANPSIQAMGYSALVGAVTALVGAIVALLVDAAMALSSNPAIALEGGFNAFGALLGVFYWPFVGAAVCGLFGLIWGSQLRPRTEAASVLPIGTLSPDGKLFWSGQAWEPRVETDS